uniref:Uncharacterized protein n=1 Tax=Arundo donax TaxID=35708 RepID=A0A0A8ZEG8_ARUDO
MLRWRLLKHSSRLLWTSGPRFENVLRTVSKNYLHTWNSLVVRRKLPMQQLACLKSTFCQREVLSIWIQMFLRVKRQKLLIC